jgi:hypothetical protein
MADLAGLSLFERAMEDYAVVLVVVLVLVLAEDGNDVVI